MAPWNKKLPPIQVETVSFRANIMLKRYQSVHVEMTAKVRKGEDPSYVIDELKIKVGNELRRVRDQKIEVETVRQMTYGQVLDEVPK